MEHVVSVPFGPVPYRRWLCLDKECADFGGWNQEPLPTRKDATGHAIRTGHEVIWIHGWQELIVPLRTAAPPPPAVRECHDPFHP